jgi:hypothetical protein
LASGAWAQKGLRASSGLSPSRGRQPGQSGEGVGSHRGDEAKTHPAETVKKVCAMPPRVLVQPKAFPIRPRCLIDEV